MILETVMRGCQKQLENTGTCNLPMTPIDWIVGVGVWGLILLGGLALFSWSLGQVLGTGRSPWYKSDAYKREFSQARKEVLRRDGHRCQRCGSGGPLHVHHVKPRARGGSNYSGNLVTLCADCHHRAHGRRF